MATELVNAAAFAGVKPAAAFAELDPTSESLADGIGSSYGIIGYKGKVWSLRLRGDTHIFTRPDDGSPAAYLDVIILRSPTYKSKSYYPAGTFADGNIGTRPTCAALDGQHPDQDIATPQSPSCAACPRNVFKTSPDGKKTRECSDYKRLAVLIVPSQSKALLGAALMEPVFLRVPAASLNELATLGEQMQAQGFHYSTYITRIGFNPEKPHPQMTFKALQALSDREAPMVLPMRVEPNALRITGESEVVGGVKLTQKAIAAPAPAEDPGIAAAALALVEKQRADALKAAAAAQAKAAADEAARLALAAQQASQPIDTGFGDLETVTKVTAPVIPAQTTTADVAVEEADSDLDARIAASVSSLLPK